MRFAETGFNLEIDLSRGSIDKMATGPETAALYLGGQGSAAKIIWDRVAPDADPCSADNLLIFSTGLLDATPVPGANRTSISCISPETNRYVHSCLGGFFGTELKHAGYDAIVIRGRAEEPVYLLIDNGRVELRDAGHLTGKSALEATVMIQKELGSAEFQVVAIGPAGEKGVVQATITHLNSSAWQGGGVVMGSKGLKAIAVRGTGEVGLAHPSSCFDSSLLQHRNINGNPRCGDVFLREDDDSWHAAALAASAGIQGYWTEELARGWEVAVESEQLSYQWENYSQKLEEVRETVVAKSALLRGTGCYNCPKGCRLAVSVPQKGIYFMKSYARLAYAMAAHEELKLNYELLCSMQEQGLDENAMIQIFAFTCALFKASILTEKELPAFPEDAADRFGYLVDKVARRDGIGDLLADGISRAADRIGAGAKAHALRVLRAARVSAGEGTSLPQLLVAATGDETDVTQMEGSFPGQPIPERETRQAFVEGWEAAPERFKQWFLAWEPGQPLPAEAAVAVADWNEAMHYLDDSLGLCPLLSSFRGQYGGRPPYHLHNLPRFISEAAGLDLDPERLLEISRRIRQLVRGINARRGAGNGAGAEYHLGMPDDPALDKELLQAYYRHRGWTDAGVPTRESLDGLGLWFVTEDLVRRGVTV